jgi:hypothetical protein
LHLAAINATQTIDLGITDGLKDVECYRVVSKHGMSNEKVLAAPTLLDHRSKIASKMSMTSSSTKKDN